MKSGEEGFAELFAKFLKENILKIIGVLSYTLSFAFVFARSQALGMDAVTIYSFDEFVLIFFPIFKTLLPIIIAILILVFFIYFFSTTENLFKAKPFELFFPFGRLAIALDSRRPNRLRRWSFYYVLVNPLPISMIALYTINDAIKPFKNYEAESLVLQPFLVLAILLMIYSWLGYFKRLRAVVRNWIFVAAVLLSIGYMGNLGVNDVNAGPLLLN